MDISVLKSKFVEEVLKIQDKNLVLKLMRELQKGRQENAISKPWMAFSGKLSNEDAKAMILSIEEDCEKINENDWK
jgi:hypothetical protein